MRELFRGGCTNCMDVLIINNDMLITAAVASPRRSLTPSRGVRPGGKGVQLQGAGSWLKGSRERWARPAAVSPPPAPRRREVPGKRRRMAW